jgi:hypothetical protein
MYECGATKLTGVIRLAWDSLRGSSMSWAHISSVLSMGDSALVPVTHFRSQEEAIQLYSFCSHRKQPTRGSEYAQEEGRWDKGEIDTASGCTPNEEK